MPKPMPMGLVSQPSWLRNLRAFSWKLTRRLAANSEHGIFHGITYLDEYKSLIKKDKSWFFAIEWEWVLFCFIYRSVDTIRFNFQSWHPFIKGIYHQLNLWKNSLSRSWLLEGNWCRKLYEKLDESWGSGQASESCRFVLRTCDRPPYPDDTYSRVITNPCAFQDLSWITEYPRVILSHGKTIKKGCSCSSHCVIESVVESSIRARGRLWLQKRWAS